MASVHDVAAYILRAHGPMSAMKLEKLAYYAQAWSLVWDERPLFPAKIEAWAAGPVVRELYRHHRKLFQVSEWPLGHADNLSPTERDTVDAVLRFYGRLTAQQLSDLTHNEDPWVIARRGLNPGERGEREITLASMHEYYSGLRPA